ncbi:MAG: 2-C-methyl-D-erythritol 4-phosphate cytidylyltransferase [Candidatus Azobacteroides sp.]|nr:2-C-methyl-D-erythritol 4-phosphate cytidylyltransferase [Candidatus Azobacteroides sp.]
MREKYLIVVAGGKGLRMGTDIPKQFLLLNGRPLLMHTIEAFYRYDSGMHIILVLPQEQQAYWQSLCVEYHFTISHRTINGGETRFHSVKNGLQEVKSESLVAIHDGVRPLVDQRLIAEAFETAKNAGAVYPVIPVVDTLRKLNIHGISRMVDRSQFRLVQTPQVFLSEVIIAAYQLNYSQKFTDDISVVEARKNCIPRMIDGCRENIKITTPLDLSIAETIIRGTGNRL